MKNSTAFLATTILALSASTAFAEDANAPAPPPAVTDETPAGKAGTSPDAIPSDNDIDGLDNSLGASAPSNREDTESVNPEDRPLIRGGREIVQITPGEPVYNEAGEEIGSVESVSVGADGSQLAIVSVGEFLGLGGKQVAISGGDLSARADGGYSVSYTEEELEALPDHVGN
jgi:hypothetical protein